MFENESIITPSPQSLEGVPKNDLNNTFDPSEAIFITYISWSPNAPNLVYGSPFTRGKCGEYVAPVNTILFESSKANSDT